MTDVSPTARALRTLELVQGRPGITADALAARLEVSPRAVRRYVAILREAGIPVESVTGPAGGYRLGRGLRLPPLVFTADEALALVMAVLDGHHEVEGDVDPAGSALRILTRSLPASVAARAEALRRTASTAPDRAAVRPDPATTSQLVAACEAGRAVHLDYRTDAGHRRELEVDPWAVVVRHGRWYLLAHAHAADEVRAYRVDRVAAVEQREPVRTPAPADLDPVAVLEAHLGRGWEHAAELWVQATPEQVGRWLSPVMGTLETDGDGATRVSGSTGNPWWSAEQLARLPVPFRVLGGPELVATTRAVGRRLQAAVGPPG